MDKLDAMIREMEAEDLKREKQALGLADEGMEEMDDKASDLAADDPDADAAEGVDEALGAASQKTEPSAQAPNADLFRAERSAVTETDIMMPDR